MKLKRLYSLFLAHFRINTRNRISFFFTIIFPLIFIGVFGIAFQEGEPGNSTIDIGLINMDDGIPGNMVVVGANGSLLSGQAFSEQFISILEEVTFDDNETNIFNLYEVDSTQREQAISDVERRKTKALIVLPTDFSLGVLAAMQVYFDLQGVDTSNYPNTSYLTEVQVLGDASLLDFNIVSQVIDQIVNIYFKLGNTTPIGGQIQIESTFNSEGFTIFDYIVPGLVIYAIINNLTTVSTVALSDVKSHLIDRFRLSKMNTWEYPLALILSQLAMSMIQIPIMFSAAFLFGFPFSWDVGYAFLFAFLLSLAMTGMGLVLAALVKDPASVGGLASIIGTPMAFLAGAFFEMPNPVLIKAGGILGDRKLGLFDLLPPRSAIDALRLILINGWTLAEVKFELVLLSLLTLFYLSLGVFLYSRKHLRPQ